MGGVVLGALFIGTEIAGTAVRMNAQRAAEEATERSIRDRMTEERISAAQKAIQKDEQVRSVVGHQISVEASSGFELDSPTFQAITIDDFNKFAEDRSIDNLQASIAQNQLQQDAEQAKMQYQSQIVGDVTGLAGNIASQTGLFQHSSLFTSPVSGGKLTEASNDELKNSNDEALKNRQLRTKNPSLFDNIGD